MQTAAVCSASAADSLALHRALQYAKILKIQSERASLPIAQYRQEVVDAVRNHQITLVAGDTGCGVRTCSLGHHSR
jgi:HrpA-like RNA helicase